MNRLTGKDELGYYMPCDITLNCLKHRGECVDYLGAYEDTGLTPGEVAKYKKFEDEAVSKGVPFSRIVELMNADKDGRLVVLPTKEVYELTWDAGPDCDLMCPVSIDGNGCFDMCDKGELCIYARPCKQEHIDQLRHDVFLTYEEAEQAGKMTEYIERKACLEKACEACNMQFGADAPCEPSECFMREKLMSIPAADVAPVVHGRWVHDGRRFKGGVDWCHCSECGRKNNFTARTKYCPNCGARCD